MEIQKDKWQLELEVGNIWKAKEILRSIIRYSYDTNIYLVYGKILYDLKDYYEAGKYLFISGESLDGLYADAIEIFLMRHQYTDTRQLISLLPKQFIKQEFSTYPKTVKEYLINRGHKAKEFDILRKEQYSNEPITLTEKVSIAALLSLFIIPFLVGVWTILKIIF